MPRTSFAIEYIRVFLISGQKYGLSKKTLNFSKPVKGLFQTPSSGENSLNAICAFKSGRYRMTRKNVSGMTASA